MIIAQKEAIEKELVPVFNPSVDNELLTKHQLGHDSGNSYRRPFGKSSQAVVDGFGAT